MALSNAERQKRYRERIKARLGAASAPAPPSEDESDDVLKQLLVGQYYAAGRDSLKCLLKPDDGGIDTAINDVIQASADEFFATDLTALDIVNIMQEAGQKAAGEIFQRRMHERFPRQSRELPPPEPEPPRRRRRRA